MSTECTAMSMTHRDTMQSDSDDEYEGNTTYELFAWYEPLRFG